MKTLFAMMVASLVLISNVAQANDAVFDCVDRMLDEHGLNEITASNLDFRMFTEACENEVGGIQQVYDTPGFRVELTTHPISRNFATVNIQSATDDLVITGVRVNRGNCETVAVNGSISMVFGQQVGIHTACRPTQILEVDVNSNRGDWTFTFH